MLQRGFPASARVYGEDDFGSLWRRLGRPLLWT